METEVRGHARNAAHFIAFMTKSRCPVNRSFRGFEFIDFTLSSLFERIDVKFWFKSKNRQVYSSDFVFYTCSNQESVIVRYMPKKNKISTLFK